MFTNDQTGNNIKKVFRSIEQLPNDWVTFSNELNHRPDRNYVKSIVTFLKGFYIYQTGNFKVRFQFSSEINRSDIYSELKKLRYPQDDVISISICSV